MTLAVPHPGVRLAFPLVLGATALALFVSSACTYSPNIPSGSLVCSPDGECPRGFTCATSGPRAGRCVTGSGTGGGGGSVGTGGASGDGGVPSSSAASYIGTWTLDPAPSIYEDCGPGYVPRTTMLPVSTLQIYATTKGATILGATWSVWNQSDCGYELYLDELGLHLNDASWSCQDPTADPPQSWALESFEVVTSDGLTAIHDAQYDKGYFPTDGTMLYCTQTIHAVMKRR